MRTYEVHSIGTIYNNERGIYIQVDREYIPALTALEGFGHINIFWWFSDFDSPNSDLFWIRNSLIKKRLKKWAYLPHGLRSGRIQLH